MRKKIGSLMVCLAGILLFVGISQPAYADFVLVIDDSTTGGLDVIVADGQSAGYNFMAGGYSFTTTAGDAAADGVISYNSSFGVWNVNVTTGISKPVVGPYEMDLNSVNVSTGASTLNIYLTDTDFMGPGIALNVEQQIGGTTEGTVLSVGGLNRTNDEFSYGATYPDDFLYVPSQGNSFGPGAFSGSLTKAVGPVVGLFSLFEQVQIAHDGAGITSFDKNLSATPIPEPSSLLLIGTGFLALAGVLRRRRG